jgi:hypothetical protein
MDTESETDHLDVSWMDEYKRLENISENCPRELMDCIQTYVLYIDKDLNIENILVESIPLTVNGEGCAIIPKDVLLKYVQDKKVKNGVKYSLYDILVYNVDLESVDIDNYLGGDEEGEEDVLSKFRGFFRSVSIIHEIVVLPSLFIFHDLNSLFVLFKERGSENEKNHRVTLKSILKKVDVLPAMLHSNTKKVRILLPNDTPMKLSDKSKTRKMI